MNRRDFLRTAGGATVVAGAVSASGSAAAQEAKTVKVGPGGSLKFDPDEVYVKTGGTVKFKWDSGGHNVVPEEQPDGANWEGHKPLEDSGFTYEATFDKKGTYKYFCEPHKAAGMEGKVIANEQGQKPGGGAGASDPEEMGVPIQAHFVGIATILAIMVSLVFTFFLLKYGESPHASGGNR